MKIKYIFFVGILFISCKKNNEEKLSSSLVWNIEKDKQIWTEQDENNFSHWVEELGTQRAAGKCTTLNTCLANPKVNKLFTEEDRYINPNGDCADIPITIRAYFAYKKKLPFIYVSNVTGDTSKMQNPDLRYASNIKPKTFEDQFYITTINQLLGKIRNSVMSGFYRMGVEVENGDTYPVIINKDGIKPGTIYYDPSGHLLMVYKVDENGNVKFIEGGFPSSTFGTTIFSEAKQRQGTASNGGGFRAWRKLAPPKGEYSNKQNKNRPIYTYLPNKDHPLFSDEQYQNPLKDINGNVLSFHRYVKYKLSTKQSLAINPTEITDNFTQLCSDFQKRVVAINTAVESGVNLIPHPGIPVNVYGSEGEWENLSTPSSDTRLRASVISIYEFIKNTIEFKTTNSPLLDYDGSLNELKKYYLTTWTKLTKSCKNVYTNSAGTKTEINLNNLLDNFWKFSFDPYHCPELRWGVVDNKLCPMDAAKWQYWEKEQLLRNVFKPEDRPVGGPTQLENGVKSQAFYDFRQLLNIPINLITKCKVLSSDGIGNVRASTKITSELLETLSTGTEVQILDKVGNWYKVETPSKKQGYINMAVLASPCK